MPDDPKGGKGALLIGIGEPPPEDELDLDAAKDMAAGDLAAAVKADDKEGIREAFKTLELCDEDAE